MSNDFLGSGLQAIISCGDGDGDVVMLSTRFPLDDEDAPDSYGRLLGTGGARHQTTGPVLGVLRDDEPDARTPLDGSGDNVKDSGDEDGVVVSPLKPGQNAVATISVSAAARLDAWVDFDGSGVFDNPAERITAPGGTAMSLGSNSLNFTVHGGAATGPTYACSRLSTAGGLTPTGLAADGEVEDY